MKLYTYRLLISWFGVQVTDDPPEEIKGLQRFSVSPFSCPPEFSPEFP